MSFKERVWVGVRWKRRHFGEFFIILQQWLLSSCEICQKHKRNQSNQTPFHAPIHSAVRISIIRTVHSEPISLYLIHIHTEEPIFHTITISRSMNLSARPTAADSEPFESSFVN